MPDKVGPDLDVQTFLRGIAKTADKPARRRVQPRNPAIAGENRTSGTVLGGVG